MQRIVVSRLALAVFFTSGFTALLYQVTWQRLLALFSGADVYSATLIVAAFMAGLGAGHLTGGHIADRVSRRTSLVLFGVAEIAIAAFGALSAALYYGFLYQRIGQSALAQEWMPLILFVSLLWPTFFMGASLPLLARALTGSLEQAAYSIGALYGFNTLGAALGATATTWWLLPSVGLEGSLRVGAVLNVACAAAVWPLARRFNAFAGLQAAAAGSVRRATLLPDAHQPRHPALWFWALAYAYAGFIALSLEIVWFRVLGVMVKSTAFTFGTLLALYLAGIGLGAVVGSARAPRARRPDLVFFGLQAAGGLLAAVLLTVFVRVAAEAGPISRYFDSYEPLSVAESLGRLGAGDVRGAALFLSLYFGLPLLLIVPSTLLMGGSFPFLQRVVQADAARIGRSVGILLVANIVGSVLGTVLTGGFLLAFLGTAGTLKLLAGMSSLFVLAGLGVMSALSRAGGDRVSLRDVWVAVGGTALALAMVLVWMPGGSQLWAVLHGTATDRIIFAEDDTGLSVIKSNGDGFSTGGTVFVNGVGQSVIPFGGVHSALGALPAFIHPDPKDAAIIGLGSGDTAFAVAGRPTMERLTSIEIIRPQLATLRELGFRGLDGGVRSLLNDPRVEHLVGDGRTFLMRSGRRFDIIEADALRPTSAYAGNLFSDAYFRLVREHLNPNGLAAAWEPSTSRVRATFLRVFPYVIAFPRVLLGSNEPIVIDREAITSRVADPRVREYYRRAGIDIDQLMQVYLAAEPVRYGPAFDRSTLTDFNTDLFPKDEFDLRRPPR